MKLLYLIPGNMYDMDEGAEIRRRQSILQSIAFEGTEVIADDTGHDGPKFIETITSEYRAVIPSVKRAIKAEQEGFDGIIVGCFADPGIDAMREMVSIPVCGPFETGCATAMTLGYRFSIITPTPSMCTGLIEEFVHKGFDRRKLASVRGLDMAIEDFVKDEMSLMQLAFDAVEKAIDEDGADTIVLGCGSLAFSNAGKLIEERYGVTVVNPIFTALKQLEGNVACGLTHSKRAYPTPTFDVFE